MKKLLFILIIFMVNKAYTQNWQSNLVTVDESGVLNYTKDSEQNRIPDFSYAGYKNGEESIPTAQVKVTISPINGDNTSHIQNAINNVASMPMGLDGLRGAVLLKAGRYDVWGSIYINASGVVLRGEGEDGDESNNTIIYAKGNSPNHRDVLIAGGGNKAENWNSKSGENVNITSSFVAVGEKTFEVANASSFSIGDNVIIHHPASQEWLNAIEGGGGSPDPAWSVNSYNITFNRYVEGISGNMITVKTPIYNHLNRSLSQSYIYKYNNNNQLRNIGVENLRIDIENSGDTSEDHARTCLVFAEVEDAWANNCTFLHFWYSGLVTNTATRITVENCNAINPTGEVTGGRRYNFNCERSSNNVLFKFCYANYARHAYISNGTSSVSGMVIYKSDSEHPFTSSEGHRHWSQGMLFDNYKDYGNNPGRVLGLYNRGDWGTSHGWSNAHSVAWNCDLRRSSGEGELVVQKPPTAQNYAIGCYGNVTGKGPFSGSAGYIEGTNKSGLEPASLYEAQLAYRLNPANNCQPASASTFQTGNDATHVLDGDLNTRWSANGDGQWIQFCLDQEKTVESLDIAFYNGDLRATLFDILLSLDGQNWINVAPTLQSSGTSLQLENFLFSPQNAKYVRILGHGNTINTWNSLTEVVVNSQPISVCAPVSASTFQTGNGPTHVLDGDLNTRWSANGDGQWIQFCLDQEKTVESLDIAFYNGDLRASLFDILLSLDGQNWTNVAPTLQSSGTSLQLENFPFSPQNAKYVRIVGHGNSINTWNSINEVAIQTGISNQTSFSGTSITIPGVVELENYDNGGEGIAYHDLTSGNEGSAYRTDDVDIEVSTEGGYNVGWVQPGEWLEYTVNVVQAGNYDFNIRAASEQSGTMRIEMDGQDVTNIIDVPTTGGWQIWVTVNKQNVVITAGTKVMRVYIISGGFNLNSIDISLNTTESQTPFSGTSITIPGIIEFENYDNGGEGIAYHDLTSGNEGNAHRTDDVDIEVSTEGGYNVGWVQPEEWLEYTVNVAQAGNYDFNISAASGQSGTMRIEMDGQDVTGIIDIATTGDWQNWVTVNKQNVTLTTGTKVMRVFIISGEFNLNNINIIEHSPSNSSDYRVVGYLPSWSGDTSNIQYDKLTHINYAFVRPTTWGALSAVPNPDKLSALVSGAHAQNVKVGIAIGGWSDLNNTDFETVAASASLRATFVTNVMNLVSQYNLDGVDIDWEYPTADTAWSFDLLMHDLAVALHAKGKFLTAAVIGTGDYYGQHIHNAVFEDVDFLNIMAYDGGSPHSSFGFAQECANYWLGRGLPSKKLVLGVPFYGRSSSSYVGYNQLLNDYGNNAAYTDVVAGIEYNGISTIKAKTQYAKDNNLGGIMIWEISQDVNDYRSLLAAIVEQFQSIGITSRTTQASTSLMIDKQQVVTVVPNPGVDQIRIVGLNEPARISIIDLSGNTVKKFNYDGISMIDISSLPQGLFIINVSTSKGVEILKLVK